MTGDAVHIQITDLSMRFPLPHGWFRRGQRKAVHAVNRVSIDLRRGECLALVGESGSGKTTLANCVAGVLTPVEGTIRLGDVVIANNGRLVGLNAMERARRIQMVFQDPTSALNPRLRISRALSEPMLVHRVCDRSEMERRVADLLGMVGLHTNVADSYPHEINASQRQRVVIARALTLGPEILIADEPIAKLDVSMQGQILNLLDKLRQSLGLTVLFITHDMSVVRQVATRVAVLYLGSLMELADRESFFAAPAHPYSQALLRSTPRLRETLDGEEIFTIKGEIPSPIDLPRGCPFSSRCALADGTCHLAPAERRVTEDRNLVWCHKYHPHQSLHGNLSLHENPDLMGVKSG